MPDRSAGDRKDAATADINPLDVSGLSPVMQKLATQLRLAAGTDASVFIVGESGAGKEVVARAIHDASSRRDRPFVAINCGAISGSLAHAELFGHEKGSFTGAVAQNAGYFEYASGGTLFLDEVTEMPPDMQVHFLRVLEAGTYQRVGGADLLRANVRIICASNRDPEQAVQEGKLREDLYYRLSVFPLELPPLRERGDDIAFLADRFLQAQNQDTGSHKAFSARAKTALAQYEWPGNVRELKNFVRRAFIMAESDELDVDLLAPQVSPGGDMGAGGQITVPVGETLAEADRRLILATLERCKGVKKQAAAVLGISPKTLYNLSLIHI